TLIPPQLIGSGIDVEQYDREFLEKLESVVSKEGFLQLFNPVLILRPDGTLIVGWQVRGLEVQSLRQQIHTAINEQRPVMPILHTSMGRVLPINRTVDAAQNKKLTDDIAIRLDEINRKLA